MILATGGEFLNVEWRGDEDALVALDMDGVERLRVTWTGWPPHRTRAQRLSIAWDVVGVVLVPALQRLEATRCFDDPLATFPEPEAEP